MRHATYLVTLVMLTSCGQPNSAQENVHNISSIDTVKTKTNTKIEKNEPNSSPNPSEQTDHETQSLSYEFENATLFKLTDTITADFNGDGKPDQALYKRENQTSGVIIKHGQTNEEVRLGFEEPFAHLTDFNWVDSCGLVNDTRTYERVIENAEIIGDREVKLENPSIVVSKEEEGGGLITFKNGRYEWVHQAD